jgi:signal transduction histidine kinase
MRAPSALRRLLRSLAWLMVVASIFGSAMFLSIERRQALGFAKVTASSTARLLEERVRRSFHTTDFLVANVAQLAVTLGMDRIATDEQAWRQLKAIGEGLPDKGSLFLFDAEGRAVIGSKIFFVPDANIADRDYFRVHAAGKESHIGPLINSRLSDIPVFTISRRITAPDGSFAGVALAAIGATFLTDMSDNLALGPHASLTIVDLVGHVVMRQPDPQKFIGGQRLLGEGAGAGLTTKANQLPAEGVGQTISPMDQVERVVAFCRLAEYGVEVYVGIAVEDALAPWRNMVAKVATALVAVWGLLGGLLALVFRSLRREESTLHGLEVAVRERTEEALDKAEQARCANDSKTRFLAAASHDLRQPLQAAGMFVEVLASRLDDPGQLVVVDKLRQSIDATNSLLTTLLDVSTLEAGRVQPTVSSFPVMSLLASLAAQIEPEIAARQLELRVVPSRARVTSDPVLLERLLRNLVHNAVRYTPTGRVLLGCRRHGDRLAIVVADTGIGIPADKLETVFEDFTRLDAVKALNGARGPGLGLGLGVVRRMAALLGHALEVRSTLGRGSYFAVLVPLAPH